MPFGRTRALTRSQCTAPDLADALVERARRHAPLDEPQLLAHLEACAACRVAKTSARGEWPTSGRTIARAFTSSPRRAIGTSGGEARRGRRRGAVFAYAACGAAAAAALLVATAPARRRPPLQAVTTVTTSSAPVPYPPSPAEPHLDGPAGRQALSNGMRVRLAAGEHAELVLDPKRPPVALAGPCIVEIRSAPGEVSGWQYAYVDEQPPAAASATAPAASAPAGSTAEPAPPSAAAASAPRSVELPATPAPSAERAWRDTAEAMKRNDVAAADRALADLCKAPDHSTRDAARLARAELWIQEGKGAAVKPVLVDLARGGATALVKKRAAELLERVR